MSTTASIIVTGALGLIGKIDPEETPGAAMLADGLRRLNLMMGTWGLQGLTIPASTRQVFPLVAGKGGPANPYTMGPGGDLNTVRPSDIASGAVVLNTSVPPVEVALTPYTEDAYNAIAIKSLSNSQPTGFRYKATFAGGLGTLLLWPVPDNTVNSLALYWMAQLGLFTSLTASYDLPEGSEEAVEYNLAYRLSKVYTVPLATIADVKDVAVSSLAAYRRSNVQMSDLENDFCVNRRGGYNINTGT